MRIAAPGHAEAVQSETLERNAAFLPVPRKLCGHWVDVLRVRHLALLQAVASPFICGGSAGYEDVVRFLCLLTPGWDRFGPLRRWLVVRRLWRLRFREPSEPFAAIQSFLDDSLADAPGGQGAPAGAAYYSVTAALVAKLAREFHWSEAELLNLPLARAWQYCAEILAHYGAPVFNRSDGVLQEWLDANQPRN